MYEWQDEIWLKSLFPHSDFLSFCQLPPSCSFSSHLPFVPTPLFLLFLVCFVSLISRLSAPLFLNNSRTQRRTMMWMTPGWMRGGRWGGIIMQETEKLPVQPSSPPSYQVSRYRVHLSRSLSHTHTNIHTPRLRYFPMWRGIVLGLLSVLLLYKPTNHHAPIPHRPFGLRELPPTVACGCMWLHYMCVHWVIGRNISYCTLPCCLFMAEESSWIPLYGTAELKCLKMKAQ